MTKHIAPELIEDAQYRRRARKTVNAQLAKIGYTDGIPVADIIRIVESVGFDGTKLHGIYCGEDGRTNESIGHSTWISISWHRMQSGRYEIVAYVS